MGNKHDLIHSLEKNATRIKSIVNLTKDKDPEVWEFPRDEINQDMHQAIDDLKKDWSNFMNLSKEGK